MNRLQSNFGLISLFSYSFLTLLCYHYSTSQLHILDLLRDLDTIKMEQFLVKFLQLYLCFLLLIIMIQLLRSYAQSSTIPLYGVKRKISKLPVVIYVTCVHLLWCFGSSKALLSGFDGHRSHWTRRIHQSIGSQSESNLHRTMICWLLSRSVLNTGGRVQQKAAGQNKECSTPVDKSARQYVPLTHTLEAF